MADEPTQLLTATQVRSDKLRGAIDQLRRDMAAHVEYAKIKAEIQKSAYDAAIAAGFDKDQALKVALAFL